MAPKLALVRVTEEILRVPDINEYLKSAGEKVATEGWHIDQLLYAVCMVLRERPHQLSLLEVIHFDGFVKRACDDRRWISDFDEVSYWSCVDANRLPY